MKKIILWVGILVCFVGFIQESSARMTKMNVGFCKDGGGYSNQTKLAINAFPYNEELCLYAYNGETEEIEVTWSFVDGLVNPVTPQYVVCKRDDQSKDFFAKYASFSQEQERDIASNCNEQLGNVGFCINKYSGLSGIQGANPESEGWDFIPTEDIIVTHLGYYDKQNKFELRGDHDVGIFSQDKVLVVKTTIRNSDPLEGQFHYRELTSPVTLNKGKIYYLMGVSHMWDYQ
jgi:hypothetical protein